MGWREKGKALLTNVPSSTEGMGMGDMSRYMKAYIRRAKALATSSRGIGSPAGS